MVDRSSFEGESYYFWEKIRATKPQKWEKCAPKPIFRVSLKKKYFFREKHFKAISCT